MRNDEASRAALASGDNVLDAARAIVKALGVAFGEISLQVSGGEIVLVRQGVTMKPADLAQIPLRPAS